MFHISSRSSPLEGDMSNSPVLCLSHYLYRSAFTTAFLNKQYIASAYFCIPFSIYICSLMTCCTRTIWYGQYTRGLSTPNHGVISPNTFTSAAPRTYSIICIGSESCLGSIVGFAQLPCFGTLRSIISAKVALGEPLRLCPG